MNRYANNKFDDVIAGNRLFWATSKNKNNLNAAGEEELENEDSVEPDAEDYSYEQDMDAPVVPKFRQLVRSKKLEFKAQYGKARFTQTNVYKRHCLGGWRDIPKDGKGPIWFPDINCSNILDLIASRPKWVWGWRKKWREFKQTGGLAQLKMVAKGMVPYVPPGTADPSQVAIPTVRGGKRNVKQTDLLENTPKTVEMDNETIVDTTKASLAGPIIFTLLVLGGIGAMIKFAK